ncbi:MULTISPECIES: dihydrofolate reductase family protein [Pseudomonas syringae group]|uniref:RibD C-terminal domain protein n=5 Tax=Pseudomonas syringae group TaxID=136849 RepID=Q889B9_PSESM|nr:MULTISPECIES: dihydrofolate reductase family protein [Pseudomonas syringae group]KPC06490.1 RibD domain protein [Pseudomonas amygdali pv. lachrymans]RMU68285.1 RibD C-terminal domain protein [Pseudomonas syringae pv. aptata]AAO54375.1 ribD C-terminal domain protein [Pseudomonas syringae pv. tomato str. DC3000]AZG84915.1 riboflavin biosynthesis protein RibD [Pseudomonas syringae pv. pisi str. PP1]EGH98451.1 ribD C-terminal domain protein [Pseudomonas amygdali pv. lachrymans str. M302278]
MKVTVFSQISIDGKLTMGKGASSKPLFQNFDDDDMRFIHKFRGEVDAIMVGRNTIVTDDPQLTNRYESGRNPIRIIPTTSLDLPTSASIFKSPEKTIIATSEQARDHEMVKHIRACGKEVLFAGAKHVDFTRLFPMLEARGINHIMVEGGGHLNWQVFNLDLVDEIILMQVPIIIGGAATATLADGVGYRDINMANSFTLHALEARPHYNLMHFKRESNNRSPY